GCTLAEIAIYQGDFQTALDRLNPWQDAVRAEDEPLLSADLFSTRALALDWLDRGEEAEPLWQRACDLHRGLQNAEDLAQLIATRAHLHLVHRNPERVAALLKE